MIDSIYLDLLRKIEKEGIRKPSPTGTDLLSIFGVSYKVPLDFNAFPILTTKKVNFRSLVDELIWYISGEPHIRNFREKSPIWNSWADQNGNLESAYGRFWRHFPISPSDIPGEHWLSKNSPFVHEFGGTLCVDQLAYLVHKLKTDFNTGRMHMEAWHPGNAIGSYLPPCHVSLTLNVIDGKVNGTLLQRRGDVPVGIPWNISCYSLLIMLLAHEAGLKPGEFQHVIVDAHIYVDQLEAIQVQYSRMPRNLPKLIIEPEAQLFQLESKHIRLEGYEPWPFIKIPVAVHQR